MSGQYVLDGHKPIEESDLLRWGQWFETADRAVAKDVVGNSRVSTVFLGLDHSFGSGPPMIFETMVFGGPMSDEIERYSTWEEAEKGHDEMVRRVRKAQP